MRLLSRFLIGIILLFAGLPRVSFSQPVIIDTDLNIDDTIAMLYLLKTASVNVKAVSIETLGTHYCEVAARNALGILRLAGQANIPVGCGPEAPLPLRYVYYSHVIKRALTLSGTAQWLPVSDKRYSRDAVALLLKTIKTSAAPVTILAIGQLTNIAAALQREPALKKNIRRIVIMGGAIHVPGNVSENHSGILNNVSEWNIYIDAPAAKKVFASGIPIRLISLDATNALPIDRKFYHKVQRAHAAPTANYFYELLKRNQKSLDSHLWYFWDPAAAVLLAHPELATWQLEHLAVLTRPVTVQGKLIEAKGGNWIEVCQHIDKDKFEALLLKTIN